MTPGSLKPEGKAPRTIPDAQRSDARLFRFLHQSKSSTTVTPHRARCDCIQEGVATALVEHPGYDDKEGPNVVEGSNQGPTRRSLEELEDAVAAAVERSRVGYLQSLVCFIPIVERSRVGYRQPPRLRYGHAWHDTTLATSSDTELWSEARGPATYHDM